jgi:hypothetical protein
LGTGTGTVQGPGLNCRAACTTNYQPRQIIGLTATADAGSVFAGWGGDCTGSVATVSVQSSGNIICTVTFNPAPPPSGPPTLEDDFTSGAQWTTTVVRSTGNPVDPQAAGTVANGGNPGGYRSMTHSFKAAGDIFVDHLFTGGTYNPSQQGAITTLDYSEDRIILGAPFAGAGVASWFILVQNNQTFERASSPNVFANTGWQSATLTGLRASDFAPGPGPNFSSTGGPIQFGYRRANTNDSPTAQYVLTHGIDNWKVVVHR